MREVGLSPNLRVLGFMLSTKGQNSRQIARQIGVVRRVNRSPEHRNESFGNVPRSWRSTYYHQLIVPI